MAAVAGSQASESGPAGVRAGRCTGTCACLFCWCVRWQHRGFKHRLPRHSPVHWPWHGARSVRVVEHAQCLGVVGRDLRLGAAELPSPRACARAFRLLAAVPPVRGGPGSPEERVLRRSSGQRHCIGTSQARQGTRAARADIFQERAESWWWESGLRPGALPSSVRQEAGGLAAECGERPTAARVCFPAFCDVRVGERVTTASARLRLEGRGKVPSWAGLVHAALVRPLPGRSPA